MWELEPFFKLTSNPMAWGNEDGKCPRVNDAWKARFPTGAANIMRGYLFQCVPAAERAAFQAAWQKAWVNGASFQWPLGPSEGAAWVAQRQSDGTILIMAREDAVKTSHAVTTGRRDEPTDAPAKESRAAPDPAKSDLSAALLAKAMPKDMDITSFRVIADFMRRLGDSFWELDLRSRVTRISPELAAVMGLNPDKEEWSPADAWDWIHPDDQEKSASAMFAYLTGLADEYRPQIRLRHHGGGYYWALVRAAVSAWEEGKPARLVGTNLDITPWKENEFALHALLASLDDVILLVDAERRYRGLWDAKGTWLEGDAASFQGLSLKDVHGEAFAEAMGARIADVMAKGEKVLWDFVHPARAGVRMQAQINPLHDELRGWVSVLLRDVTDALRRDHALSSARERLAFALRAGNFGVWDWDLATDTILWDDRQFAIYGVDPETFRPSHASWQTFVHPDDWAQCSPILAKAFAEDGGFDMTYRIWQPALKEWRWIRDQAFLVRDEARKPVRVVGVNCDVTEQKRAENTIKAQTQFIESVINAVPDPIFVQDSERRWLYANEAFAALMGLPRNGFLGRSDIDFRDPAALERSRLEETLALASGQAREMEEAWRDKAGSERNILTKMTPSLDLDGNPILVGVIRDITERKRLGQEVAIERARAAHAAKLASLGQMAGGIAHEINNPLAIICGAVRRLQRINVACPDPADAHVHATSIGMIERTAERIAKIVRGLRLFARDGEDDPFTLAPVAEIIEDTLSMCRAKFYNHDVTLRVESAHPDTLVECRAVQISQVLLNLLNNAFDAVEGMRRAWVVVETQATAHAVDIAVVDSGPGVPPEFIPHIMEPFFTTKDVGHGTGLGLSISSGIARAHQGNLFLDTQSPYTRFVLHLPLVQTGLGKSSL